MRTIRRCPIIPVLLVIACLGIKPTFGQFRGRGESDSDRDRGRYDRDSERGSDRDSGRESDRGSFRGFGSRGDDDSRGDDRGSSRFGGGFGPPGGFGPSSGRFGSSDGGFRPPGGGFGPPGGFRPPEGGDQRGGDGRPSPEMFFDRLDRNGDGRLEGDEIPQGGFFGGMLERAGIKEGSSREDFTRGFERMREERESGGDNNRERDRSDDRGRSNQPTGFVPAKRERVTLDLPESLIDRDQDGDGQIAFHEWRTWDRTQIDEFFYLDRNGDGFLTPKELVAVSGEDDRRGNSAPRVETRRERPSEPSSQMFAARSQTGPGGSLDENDADVRKGRNYFTILDANKDGRASVEELGALKKLKPAFEEAGVNLNVEMTADEFVRNYLRTVKK